MLVLLFFRTAGDPEPSPRLCRTPPMEGNYCDVTRINSPPRRGGPRSGGEGSPPWGRVRSFLYVNPPVRCDPGRGTPAPTPNLGGASSLRFFSQKKTPAGSSCRCHFVSIIQTYLRWQPLTPSGGDTVARWHRYSAVPAPKNNAARKAERVRALEAQSFAQLRAQVDAEPPSP